MAENMKFDVVYSMVNFEMYFPNEYYVNNGKVNYYYKEDAAERFNKVVEQIKEGKKILFLSTRIYAPKTELDKLLKKVILTIANIETIDSTSDAATIQLYNNIYRQFINGHIYHKFVQNKKRLVEMIDYTCENYVTEDTELYYCDYILDTLMKSE